MTSGTLEEQANALKAQRVYNITIVLSNILELATSVVLGAAGKDIADSITKESLNRNVLANLVANRIKEKILTEGGKNA